LPCTDAPLSETIISVFACTKIGTVFYLREDMEVECYTPSHMRYYRAGVFWLIFYCFGIPVFFLAMLFTYGIPQAARRLRSAGAVRALVDLAWQRRIPQPDVNTSTLDAHNISDEHVDALYRGVFHHAHGGHAHGSASPYGSASSGGGSAGQLIPSTSLQELPDVPRAPTPTPRSDSPILHALAAEATLQLQSPVAAPAASSAAPRPPSLLRRVMVSIMPSTEGPVTREQKLKRLIAWSKARVRGTHLSWHDVPHEVYAHAAGISDLYHHFYIHKWCGTCAPAPSQQGTDATPGAPQVLGVVRAAFQVYHHVRAHVRQAGHASAEYVTRQHTRVRACVRVSVR
jgi:hypothetical protein